MKAILKARSRKKSGISVCYGKEKGIIIPSAAHRGKYLKSADHPFFGFARSDSHDVAVNMEKLRGGRYVCRGGSRTAPTGKTKEDDNL